jgi:hypothetical protein
MFSIEELNRTNVRHGDLHGRSLDFIDPADLNPAKFDGTGTLRDAIITRDRLVNTLRRKGLDQFLTKPLEDFLPNPLTRMIETGKREETSKQIQKKSRPNTDRRTLS